MSNSNHVTEVQATKERISHARRLNVLSTLPGLSVGNILHIKGTIML